MLPSGAPILNAIKAEPEGCHTTIQANRAHLTDFKGGGIKRILLGFGNRRRTCFVYICHLNTTDLSLTGWKRAMGSHAGNPCATSIACTYCENRLISAQTCTAYIHIDNYFHQSLSISTISTSNGSISTLSQPCQVDISLILSMTTYLTLSACMI